MRVRPRARQHRFAVWQLTAVAVGASLLGGTLPSAAVHAATPAPAAAVRAASSPGAPYFAPNSPFNTTIPANAKAVAKSAAMVQAMLSSAPVANLVQYGIPIYEATSTTPRVRVACTAPWGTCPLAGLGVPLQGSYVPSSGSDGAMVVVDRSTGQSFEFWRLRRTGSSWTTEWGGVSSLSGSGWQGVATASGASRLGGVVLVRELKNGLIPHALVFQSSQVCAVRFVAPATKTDGTSTSSSCIPEGARVQLDPSVDLKRLNLSKAERAIAVALQQYGAYVIDYGGASLSISFERDADARDDFPGSAYAALGFQWDYQALVGIPWAKLRVVSG